MGLTGSQQNPAVNGETAQPKQPLNWSNTLELTLASHTTLTYAELDTVFASVSNIVNQRPIAVHSYTEEDLHAITPNDLLLGRSKNTVPGVMYNTGDSVTKRHGSVITVVQ